VGLHFEISTYITNVLKTVLMIMYGPNKGEESEEFRILLAKSFRTGRLERELQMVQLSATKCSFIAIL
jgi:hypothetical protein